MHPDRGILYTHRRSDSLSTIPMTRTPSLANPPIQKNPSGIPSTAPLHVILPGHNPTLRYSYVYVYVYIPVHLRHRHDHCEHCAADSRARPFSHQVSDASAIVGIRISVLAAVSDWIRLNCFFI